MANQNKAASTGAKRATQRISVVAIALHCGALGGCARQLPGPDECHDFALVWVLGPQAASVRRVTVSAAKAIDERTTECLTTPYDRELVQCVTTGTGRQSCLSSFAARHRLPAPAPER
jgi:hypothetical protein